MSSQIHVSRDRNCLPSSSRQELDRRVIYNHGLTFLKKGVELYSNTVLRTSTRRPSVFNFSLDFEMDGSI